MQDDETFKKGNRSLENTKVKEANIKYQNWIFHFQLQTSQLYNIVMWERKPLHVQINLIHQKGVLYNEMREIQNLTGR